MEQLKRLRVEKGLSQARLAARAELDPSTVNQIERGAREASPATLRKLADALGISLFALIEGDEVPLVEAPSTPGQSDEELERVLKSCSKAPEDLAEDYTALQLWDAMPTLKSAITRTKDAQFEAHLWRVLEAVQLAYTQKATGSRLVRGEERGQQDEAQPHQANAG
jgi:transcriptional regulator with XRE-family HTH domain